MNNITLLLCTACLLALSQCQFPDHHVPIAAVIPSVEEVELPGTIYPFEKNGKVITTETSDKLYTRKALDNVELPRFSRDLISGLQQQLKVLNYRKNKSLEFSGELDLNIAKLEKVVKALLDQQYLENPDLSAALDAYQLKGKDGKGNVYFTGYFTPVLKVSREKTGAFQYPIYAYPKNWAGRLPSRGQIDGEKVLEGKGLELAYAKSPLDIYFMQVQGSGFVEYPDGSQELFSYAGSNGWKYRSIGQLMIRDGHTNEQGVSLNKIKQFFREKPHLTDTILFENPSYVFFTKSATTKTPKGAGYVPLTTDYSVAVDPEYIPIGSCLLAAVPIINKANQVVRHEYRVLLAQDVGGVIKGSGHVDLYTGVGNSGRRKASALHHYGKLWLLLPKSEEYSPAEKKLTASL